MGRLEGEGPTESGLLLSETSVRLPLGRAQPTGASTMESEGHRLDCGLYTATWSTAADGNSSSARPVSRAGAGIAHGCAISAFEIRARDLVVLLDGAWLDRAW